MYICVSCILPMNRVCDKIFYQFTKRMSVILGEGQITMITR